VYEALIRTICIMGIEKKVFVAVNLPAVLMIPAAFMFQQLLLGFYGVIWFIGATLVARHISTKGGPLIFERLAHNVGFPNKFIPRDGLRGRSAIH
jgi:hypothetical protein